MPRQSRPPLTRERVIEAALAVVERAGAKKLTMRAAASNSASSDYVRENELTALARRL